MQKLMLLYWGTFLLMKLSHLYYPVEHHGDGHRLKQKNFMWQKSDIFMILTITWMTCFSFLRTRYNDTENYIFSFKNCSFIAIYIIWIVCQSVARKYKTTDQQNRQNQYND